MNRIYEDGYTKLGNAIILQAARDYREVLKSLKKYPQNSLANYTKNQIEDFLHSSLYGMITTIDPDVLIRKLKREVLL